MCFSLKLFRANGRLARREKDKNQIADTEQYTHGYNKFNNGNNKWSNTAHIPK